MNKRSPKDREGSKVEILGQKPPCARCQKRMARWAKKNKATVVYKWTGEKGEKGAKGKQGVFTVSSDGDTVKKEMKVKKGGAGPDITKMSDEERRKVFDKID